jgi:6-phosphogluconolactonase
VATTDVELRVSDDPAGAVAQLLAEVSGDVALSGGGTVGRAYALAAGLRQDWSGVRAWYGDDRAVPPEHPDSNHRLAHETLLSRVEVAPAVHRIEGELGAEEAARRYDAALDGVVLELALNGIGPDGHTASLFPGAPGLEERERRAIAAEAGLEPFVPRVTMTPPVFAAARLLVYLVAGAEKADAVRRAFAEPPSAATPASLIRGVETVAFLDPAAAAALERL